MDWVQRLSRVRIVDRHVVEFQSLLSWIGFKDSAGHESGSLPAGVSILVVVDWVQRPNCDTAFLGDAGVSILVVVDWVQRPG